MTKCGYAAIVGAPNAGKSTLLNDMAGVKLSIVTPKPQTTRFRVLGVVMRGETQVLLVDTPGIFQPMRRLDRAMVAAAWVGMKDADVVLLTVDAKAGLTQQLEEILSRLSEAKSRYWLVINKIDLLAKPALLLLSEKLNAMAPFEKTFMVSAKTGNGVDRLLDNLAKAMPDAPFLYPPDHMTDLPERLLAAEIVREQIFLQTHDEVPFSTTVETEFWQERKDSSVRVDCTIYVARAGQKAIVIGEKGARIRTIGARARSELAKLIERPVHLFLQVKERPAWDGETARLRAIGLEDVE